MGTGKYYFDQIIFLLISSHVYQCLDVRMDNNFYHIIKYFLNNKVDLVIFFKCSLLPASYVSKERLKIEVLDVIIICPV